MASGQPNRTKEATACFKQAAVFQSQGKYDAALELYRKSLDIFIKVFGADHPSVATTYSNMGCVYNSQGKYEEALRLFEKSLAIDIEVYGPEHPVNPKP